MWFSVLLSPYLWLGVRRIFVGSLYISFLTNMSIITIELEYSEHIHLI